MLRTSLSPQLPEPLDLPKKPGRPNQLVIRMRKGVCQGVRHVGRGWWRVGCRRWGGKILTQLSGRRIEAGDEADVPIST